MRQKNEYFLCDVLQIHSIMMGKPNEIPPLRGQTYLTLHRQYILVWHRGDGIKESFTTKTNTVWSPVPD